MSAPAPDGGAAQRPAPDGGPASAPAAEGQPANASYQQGEPERVPAARLSRERRVSPAWLLPILALAFAIYLFAEAFGARGPLVTVRARDGHGIQAGDPLRYRGIQVGEIESVRLAPDLASVALAVRLDAAAASLAREGARFWLVRPQLSLEGVQGLETIVGANYLAVLPGPPDAAPRSEFTALEEAPIRESIEPGGLTIVLEAPERFGLAPGAPLTFRDFQVGTVLSLALASDATAVEIAVYVRRDYAGLVRENTRFWKVGGVELDFGLTSGLRIEIGSLRSFVVGAVAMATPTDAGPGVQQGHRFRLHAAPEPDWQKWRPALPVGRAGYATESALPRPVRATLSWREGRMFSRKKSRSGWVLPVEGGVVGPADLLRPVERARDDGARLELEGGSESHALREEPQLAGPLAFLPIELEGAEPWPASRVAPNAGAGDWLVVGDPALPPLAVAALRLRPDELGWSVAEGPSFDPAWHGAAVIERASGTLVGILLAGPRGARIARPPAELWRAR